MPVGERSNLVLILTRNSHSLLKVNDPNRWCEGKDQAGEMPSCSRELRQVQERASQEGLGIDGLFLSQIGFAAQERGAVDQFAAVAASMGRHQLHGFDFYDFLRGLGVPQAVGQKKQSLLIFERFEGGSMA